jgi:hypothetical protein
LRIQLVKFDIPYLRRSKMLQLKTPTKIWSYKFLAVASTFSIVYCPATVCYAAEAVNFKIYSPEEEAPGELTKTEAVKQEATEAIAGESLQAESPKLDTGAGESEAAVSPVPAAESTASSKEEPLKKVESGDVLQGYVRTVPTGTKIPIIMDTAVDSETSQEGDEFSARTSEDLSIDGNTVVPAGSIIRGRIAQLMAPRAMNRSGAVQLKFDTITTPDNRQIPLVANVVAKGGVVHARRGMKDVVLDAGAVSLPTLAGLGIGLLAGNGSSSSSIGAGGGAVIGAGIGLAVGVAVLLAKKGKKIDVRPGDELKIELAEELRMPSANM